MHLRFQNLWPWNFPSSWNSGLAAPWRKWSWSDSGCGTKPTKNTNKAIGPRAWASWEMKVSYYFGKLPFFSPDLRLTACVPVIDHLSLFFNPYRPLSIQVQADSLFVPSSAKRNILRPELFGILRYCTTSSVLDWLDQSIPQSGAE